MKMKSKILKVIGIAGITLFAAGYATAVLLNKKDNSHKKEQEDVEDPEFDQIKKIYLTSRMDVDDTMIQEVNYSLEKEDDGDDWFLYYHEETRGKAEKFSPILDIKVNACTITDNNARYIYKLLTYYPLNYLTEEKGYSIPDIVSDFDGYFETADDKVFTFKAPDNMDSVIEELELFVKDSEEACQNYEVKVHLDADIETENKEDQKEETTSKVQEDAPAEESNAAAEEEPKKKRKTSYKKKNASEE